MLFVYPAIFHKVNDSYLVEFPDLEGCETYYGDTINKAMAFAQEALSGYLLTFMEQGRLVASPSDISSIHSDDGFTSLVSCDINPYKDTKTITKTVTIPSWLYKRATYMELDFSQVLQEALLSKIQTK